MEHDHSSHSHSHDHSSSPAKSIGDLRHPLHGSYEGHVVPGLMFIIWSTYWIWSIIDIHLRTRAAGLHSYLPLHSSTTGGSSSSNKTPSSNNSTTRHRSTGRGEPFRSRAWYPWPYWPIPPLEPIFKVVLPLIGVLIELYIGWGGWRPLYKADGHFAEFHANNWQHALMYSGVAVSGMVDLIGYFTPLPPGTEQGFLTLSFLVETLLMGMHAKPNELDQLVHLLLTWIMIACVVVSALEIAKPQSFLVALLRGMLVFFQGTWFWHVGAIMFKSSMAWDMDDMGGVMFVPVVFSLHMILICLGTFSLYMFMRWVYVRLGITSSPAALQSAGLAPHGMQQHGHAAVYTAENLSDIDLLLESQLELADYGTSGSLDASATRVRDSSRNKDGPVV